MIFLFISFPCVIIKDDKDTKNCLSSCIMGICGEICFRCIYIPLVILYILSLIVQIILFSVLCGKYNYSDTNNFLNFLECNNFYKEASELYSIVNDYSYHIVLLKVFHSFYIVYCFILIALGYIISNLKDNSLFEEITYNKKDEKDVVNDKDNTQIILNN